MNNAPLNALRYHVTGAIERGEKEAIVEQTSMTKTAFLAAYEKALLNEYVWAADDMKRARFMLSASLTIQGNPSTWNHDGPAVTAAWHSIGGKGKPTLKALRALAP